MPTIATIAYSFLPLPSIIINMDTVNLDMLGGSSPAIMVFMILVIGGISVAWFRSQSSSLHVGATRSASYRSIPHVLYSIPFIGSTLEYSANPSAFCAKYRTIYGDTYYAKILGRDWLFLHDQADIEKVMKSSEKQVSFYRAIFQLAGRFMPKHDDLSRVENPQIRAAFPRIVATIDPATPHFAFALKANRLRTWIPGMTATIHKQIVNTLQDGNSGTIDLFDFCFRSISFITSRVLLGENVIGDDFSVSEKWIKLVNAAEPDKLFSSGIVHSIRSICEVTYFGELQAYPRARALIIPFIDIEIERCIRGEPERDDFPVLGALVRSLFKQNKNDPDIIRTTHTRIANHLFSFSFAAVTNSFGAAAWVIFHVLSNIDGIGDRVLKEIMDEENVTNTNFPELESLILEIGRLYTPGSFVRKTVQPLTLPSLGDEVIIPAGTMMSFNAAILHRNLDAFPDPLQFRPSRHLDSDGKVKNGTMLLPFGGGIHPCTGRKFAILEVAIFVREIFQLLDLSLVIDEKWEPDPKTFEYVTNVPNHPKLDMKQNHSIWRPAETVRVHVKRKTSCKIGS
jgi:cytochrome P450